MQLLLVPLLQPESIGKQGTRRSGEIVLEPLEMSMRIGTAGESVDGRLELLE
jgi:hypothetical protein